MSYAVLPDRVKPSLLASRDKTRPLLCSLNLAPTADGGWELQGTDSFKLATIPLRVREDHGEPLTPGPIPMEAMKAIEKREARAFRANGTVEPVTTTGASLGQTFTRPDVGKFPGVDALIPVPPADDQRLVIGLDASLLLDLAKAGGAHKNLVFLTLDLAKVQDGTYLRPYVASAGACSRALLMPVRPPKN